MKSLIRLSLLFLLLIPAYVFANNDSSGVYLKDTVIHQELPGDITNQQIHFMLGTMIMIPKGQNFDQREVKEMTRNIASINPDIIKALYRHNVKIRFFTGNLTDLSEFSHLKGLQPKGWSEGSTWDDVPGAGGKYLAAAKIGHSNFGEGHGSINLELHEIAHSFDNKVLQKGSNKDRFMNIWKNEAATIFPENKYFISFPEEYFAETFAMFYMSEQSRAELHEKAPKTYEYFQGLEDNMNKQSFLVFSP